MTDGSKKPLVELPKDEHATKNEKPKRYVLEPVHRSWSPDAAKNVFVRRFGFHVVPDLAGTIHSFVGTSLDALMLDCLHFARTPNREDMLRADCGISRATSKEGLLIVRPYHPMLFKQGALP